MMQPPQPELTQTAPQVLLLALLAPPLAMSLLLLANPQVLVVLLSLLVSVLPVVLLPRRGSSSPHAATHRNCPSCRRRVHRGNSYRWVFAAILHRHGKPLAALHNTPPPCCRTLRCYCCRRWRQLSTALRRTYHQHCRVLRQKYSQRWC
jgi:hypothetical protein